MRPPTHHISVFLYLFIFILSTPCYGQSKAEKEKVRLFKQDFLTGASLYKADTLAISTAILTRERRPEVRCISTYPKGQQIRQDECYYNDTGILEHTSSIDLQHERLTGMTRKFDQSGQLEYLLDHDDGTWEVVKADHYPYYPSLVKMKAIADSLIITVYGQSFFSQNVRWSPITSVSYDGRRSGAGWCDYQTWEPRRYLLKYDIHLTDDESYDNYIEVQLDSTGHLHFPFGEYNDIKGFDDGNMGHGFVLDKTMAIEKAMASGMVTDEEKKPVSFLSWKYDFPHHTDMFNGHFLYSVAINTKALTLSAPNRKPKVNYKYDVYLFDPWTGELKGIDKMKAYGEPGKPPSVPAALMPDL